MKITPIILAGGGGARLWPLSTPAYPKPLLRLFGDRSLLQATAHRFRDQSRFTAPVLSVGQAFADDALADLHAEGVAPALTIVEPVGRNTAAAIAAAALSSNPEATLLIAPADHVISDEQAFHAALEAASLAIAHDKIVVFGVTPERPETGFGYAVPSLGESIGAARPLQRFVEKPDGDTAKRLIHDGALWNAGMFFGRTGAFLRAFEDHAAEIVAGVKAATPKATGVVIRLESAFGDVPAAPFDKAVMEKTADAAVAPLDCGWSDVGDWAAVWRASPKDSGGNVLVGDVRIAACNGCYIRGEGAVAAAQGLTNMIVVATADGTLTIPMAEAQAVRSLADAPREHQ
ncbi:MAG: mannose-1-phosphate guanylyltransferase [Alphaproteobacteria bacterium]